MSWLCLAEGRRKNWVTIVASLSWVEGNFLKGPTAGRGGRVVGGEVEVGVTVVVATVKVVVSSPVSVPVPLRIP